MDTKQIHKTLKHGITISALIISSLLAGQVSAEPAEPTQRFIVKYKDASQIRASQSTKIQKMMERLSSRSGLSLQHIRKMGLENTHVINLKKNQKRSQFNSMMRQLRLDPNVLSVEEDALMQPNFVPNDTFYDLQWHYHEAIGGINAETAWDTHNGAGVVVAIIDTGITDHSDLNANVLPGYDFISDLGVANDGDLRDADPSDPGDWVASFECGFNAARGSSWHGTHTGGTVAAITDNGQGVAGVAYGASILPVRVLGKCGGFLSDIADAIIWASGSTVAGIPDNANPAQIINMSLGGSGACDSTYQDAIDIAVANGTTVVVSAGNSSADASGFRPANCNSVITVAANDREGNLASYSNFGSIVDVTAPGGETAVSGNGVASTLNDGAEGPGSEIYVYYQGTSMSAPHVSGVAALLYQANPTITPAEVETALIASARPMPGSCTGGCGAGIIDARAAIDSLGTVANIAPTSNFTVSLVDLDASFTDSSTDSDGSVVSWSWDFGDGNSSTSQNPLHNYAADGTYSVTLTVTDNEAATGISSQDVIVNSSNIAPISSFTYDAVDLQVTFADGSSDSDGSVVSWSWDFGDGNTSALQNPSNNYAIAGSYAVTLTVTDNEGATNSDVQTVTVDESGGETSGGFTETNVSPASRQNLSYTIEVPGGATSLVVETSGGTGDVDLIINFGSAPTRTDNDCIEQGAGNVHSCTITNPLAGTWFIIVRGVQASSGVQLDAHWFAGSSGNNAPIANFSYTTSELQASFSDLSSDSDGSVVSYDWDFGDGNTSTDQNPVNTYAVAGSYTVTLTVTDNEGSTNSNTQTVTVSEGGTGTSGGFTETGISPALRENILFTIDVPAGATSLVIDTSGGTGDVDLVVNFGSQPSRTDNDCIEQGTGNVHNCTLINPAEGTWFIIVRGASASTNAQLDAYWFQ